MSNFFTNIRQKFNNATKYINVSIFLITFLLGLIYIYCFDYNRKVEVYPTPHNIDKIELIIIKSTFNSVNTMEAPIEEILLNIII